MQDSQVVRKIYQSWNLQVFWNGIGRRSVSPPNED